MTRFDKTSTSRRKPTNGPTPKPPTGTPAKLTFLPTTEEVYYSIFDSFGKYHSTANVATNWNGTMRCSPDAYTSLSGENLKEELTHLVRTNKKLRVCGRALNFNNITYSEDHLVSFERANRVIAVRTLDELIPGTTTPKTEIKIQPGMMGRDLANTIDRLGYGLPNMANFLHQTIGGVVNSGSHGTLGRENRGGYLSMITEIRMVDGNGDDLVLRKEDGTLEFAVGLGCVGLIYEITMVLDVERYYLEQRTEWFPRDQFSVEMVERDIASNFLVMYKTLPTHDKIERFTFNKVDSTEDNHSQVLIKNTVDYQFVPRILISVTEMINRFNFNSAEVMEHVNHLAMMSRPESVFVSKSHHVVPDASATTDHAQTEWAVRIEDVANVLRDIQRIARNIVPVKLSEVHVRFSAASSVLLHPAYQRRVAWVDLNTLGVNASTYERHEQLIEVMRKYDARPHWAKQHFLNGSYIESVYSSEAIERFKAFRERHDRRNVLLSPYVQAMFSIYENDETFMNSKYGLTQVKRLVGSDPSRCVVLVPGFSIAYQDIFEPFASGLHDVTVVTYNHQGRGESTSDSVHPYDRTMFVDILERIIETYCASFEEITLLGVSMGGAVVGDFMSLRGKDDPRIKHLVLCAPFAMCGVPVKDKAGFHVAAALPASAYERLSFNHIVDAYRNETSTVSDANIKHIQRYLTKHGVEPYYKTITNYMNATHFHEMWLDINRLDVPKTIIYGSADTVVPYRANGALVDGEYHFIANGLHNLIKDSADALQIVQAVLRVKESP